MGKRLESVDIAKGLLIIFICCLHIGNSAMPWTEKHVTVGAFLFISGYFYKPNRGYKANLKRRTKQILIPFLLYGAIGLLAVFAFELLQGKEIGLLDLADAFLRHVFDNYTFHPFYASTTANTIALYVLPMWFLMRLYIAELIMFSFADWAICSAKRMLFVVGALLTATFLWGRFVGIHILPFQISTCFAFIAVLLAGAYAGEHNVFDYIENGRRDWRYWGIALAALGLLIGLFQTGACEYRIVKGFFGDTQTLEQMWTVYPWFIMSICSAYIVVLCSSLLAKLPVVKKVLSVIGQNTLMILSSHQVLAYILMTLINIPLFISRDATEKHLVIRILAIIVCIALGIALNKGKDKIKQLVRK